MGMSASQARLLSLTARMHDLEFQAQSIQYSKLDLVNTKQDIYDEYLDVLDSTKYQMSVLTANGNEFRDITYTNMISASVGTGLHSMYIVTNMTTGQVYLPEQITSKIGDDSKGVDPLKSAINPKKPDGSEKTVDEKLDEYLTQVAKTRVFKDGKDKAGNRLTSDAAYLNAIKSDSSCSYWTSQFFNEMPSEEDFMLVVAKNYLYSSRIDLNDDESYITEMKADGNYDYWKAVYYQVVGYKDDDGKYIGGRGFCTISRENAVDRGWLEKTLNSGDAQLFKLTNEKSLFNKDKINIFAETSLGTDPEITEVQNEELIAAAEVKYEQAVEDINAKETKLDLRLSRIDAQHQALKTEYDSVKQIVSKNIDRSFKSFNA
jgi:hypothetical protein